MLPTGNAALLAHKNKANPMPPERMRGFHNNSESTRKMEAKYAIKNGELTEKENASVSVYNKAMFFDFCVYGNIKTVQGKMLMPDSNVENLFHSAEIIVIEHRFKIDGVVSWAR